MRLCKEIRGERMRECKLKMKEKSVMYLPVGPVVLWTRSVAMRTYLPEDEISAPQNLVGGWDLISPVKSQTKTMKNVNQHL